MEIESNFNLVAVYGTLLKGQDNHRLIANSKLLGNAIIHGFNMFNIGSFPGIKEGDNHIEIEVYEVDNDTFKRLDILEGYPYLYDRKLIHTMYGDAWIYVYNGNINSREEISSGSWRQFINEKYANIRN